VLAVTATPTFVGRRTIVGKRNGEGLEPPTFVLFFSDQSPDDR
jgi:hypothetical protein